LSQFDPFIFIFNRAIQALPQALFAMIRLTNDAPSSSTWFVLDNQLLLASTDGGVTSDSSIPEI